MAQKKETAVVYSQEELAPGIFSMWIVTDIADEARPGQFISVYSQDGSRPVSYTHLRAHETSV